MKPARVAVRLTPAGLRRVRSGHPWVFETSVRSASEPGEPGDLAVVFDDRRRFVAVGLWDPTSPIRVRVLSAGEPATIDESWVAAKVGASVVRRGALATDAETDAWRAVHGENDGLPGVVVDRYGSVAVIKLYTAAWLRWLPGIIDAVTAALAPATIVLRLSRHVAKSSAASGLGDGAVLLGETPLRPHWFREHGLWFGADVVAGHKTGHFLDQRDNRSRAGTLARGAVALDVFACTGGFTLAMAAGGATSVTSVDSSAPALAAARINVERNRESIGEFGQRSVVGDAFVVLDDLTAAGERFDLVVVDPPSFASRREQIPRAVAAYSRIFRAALDLVDSGGVAVLASCSSRITADHFDRVVEQAATDVGVALEVIDRTSHPVDHPIGFADGAYLKAVFARVARPPLPRSHER